jgi:uncharacterized protein YndB with AHSA1/START domain
VDDYRQAAPVAAHSVVEVAASPREVWSVLADIESWSIWNPAIREIWLEDDLEIGTHFRWATGPGTITFRLTEVDAPTRLAWSGAFMSLRHHQSWHIVVRPGGCVVTADEVMTGLAARLFSKRLKRTLQQDLDTWVGLLKLEAEARKEVAADESIGSGDTDDPASAPTRPPTMPHDRPAPPPGAAS